MDFLDVLIMDSYGYAGLQLQLDLTSYQMPKTQHGLVSLVDGNGLELIILIHQREVVFKEITHIEAVILGSHG